MTPPTSPERDLVKAMELGDAAACAALYDRYAPVLFRIGYTLLGNQADAEDLTHDVFLGLPRALKTYEGRGSFEGWLKRVATRTALMKLRQMRKREGKRRQFRSVLPRVTQPPPIETSIDLEQALDLLKPAHRAVFVLRIVHGYNTKETAELLGIRIGTVRIRLLRARRALRTMLTE